MSDRIYYSLFVTNEDGRVVELEEKFLWKAEKLAQELRAEGLHVEILERYDGALATDDSDYNDAAARRKEWARY